jgi:aryl-alcohol dehydrogenase-like predicted oxidoreductase
MEYRHLGSSGLLVSAMGLGTNNFGSRLDEARSKAILEKALDLGVTMIDTADVYGKGQSETLIGEILGSRRHQVVLATKFGMAMSGSPYERGGSRRWIMRAVEDSLRRLKTDYIDLYQMHAPDPETSILETMQALDDLVTQGKVRYIGHSNLAAWEVVDAQWTARSEHLALPISAQHYYSLLSREIETDVLEVARRLGLGVIPYYPLESGFLTGKYRPDTTPAGARLDGSPRAARVLTPENFVRLERLEAFAAGRGHSLLELSLGWLLSHPEVGTVIAGASSAEQVEENIAASTWRLNSGEMEEVAAI